MMESPLKNAPESKKKMTVIATVLSVLAMIFYSSAKTSMLPLAAAEIGGSDYYTIASTIPSVVGVVCMPLFGFLCARNPAMKTKLFMVGMLMGTVGLTASAFVNNLFALTVAQSLITPTSACAFVCGYSLIGEMYDREKAGVYLGLCASTMAIGQLVAPILGGIIMDALSWRAFCIVCAVITVLPPIVMLFGAKLTGEEAAAMSIQGMTFDVLGALGLVMFLGGFVLAMSLGSSLLPFGSAANTACFAVCVIGLVILVVDIKKKGFAAIIPAPALKDKNTLFFAVGNALNTFSSMSVFFFMPTYVLYVLNGSATQAGIPTTCFGLLGVVLGAVFGKMAGRTGSIRSIALVGNIERIVILVVLAVFLKPTSSVWFVFIMMFLGGVFNSAATVTYSTGPQIMLKPDVRTSGNSVVQTAQNFGSLLGTTTYTMVIGMFGIVQGMSIALFIATGVGFLNLLCVLPLKTLEQQGVEVE